MKGRNETLDQTKEIEMTLYYVTHPVSYPLDEAVKNVGQRWPTKGKLYLMMTL